MAGAQHPFREARYTGAQVVRELLTAEEYAALLKRIEVSSGPDSNRLGRVKVVPPAYARLRFPSGWRSAGPFIPRLVALRNRRGVATHRFQTRPRSAVFPVNTATGPNYLTRCLDRCALSLLMTLLHE